MRVVRLGLWSVASALLLAVALLRLGGGQAAESFIEAPISIDFVDCPERPLLVGQACDLQVVASGRLVRATVEVTDHDGQGELRVTFPDHQRRHLAARDIWFSAAEVLQSTNTSAGRWMIGQWEAIEGDIVAEHGAGGDYAGSLTHGDGWRLSVWLPRPLDGEAAENEGANAVVTLRM